MKKKTRKTEKKKPNLTKDLPKSAPGRVFSKKPEKILEKTDWPPI